MRKIDLISLLCVHFINFGQITHADEIKIDPDDRSSLLCD